MLIVMALDVLFLAIGILYMLRPRRVNEFSRRLLCSMRLMKRAKLDKPVPRWENILTCLIGVAFIVFTVSDLHDVRVGVAPRQVATWESPTVAMLDASTRNSIDKSAMGLIRSGKCMGMVVGIVDGDKGCVLGYGRKDFRSATPPDADTVFEIGSITKTFTTLSLGILSQRGKVRLDDPLSRYLPASVHVPAYKGRQITIADLATHTSGLPSLPGNPLRWLGSNPYPGYSNELMYRDLSAYKLTRAPGAAYDYSNMGMGLVGLALSRTYGTSYEEMARDLVWKPLDMTDTAIKLSNNQRLRFAQGYALQSNLGRLQFVCPSSPWTFQDCFNGAGGTRSTANDMMKYLRANLGLNPKAKAMPFDLIQKPSRDIGDDMWIGLGWHGLKLNKKDSLVWHNGGTGGYSSFIAFSKKDRKGILILINSNDENGDVDALGFKLLISMLKNG